MAERNIPEQAIIDTSVLLSLYHLNLLSFLNLIYTIVRVPREVEKEFLQHTDSELERSKRYDFLQNFYNDNNTWFIPCNEYGSDIVDLYLTEKNFDRGEAEVFAQNQATDSISELLLDEKIGRKFAERKFIQHHGVLFIIATFEISFQCCGYRESIKILQKKKIGRFTNSVIESVYIKVNESR